MTEKIGNYPRPATDTKATGSKAADRTSRSGAAAEAPVSTGDDAVSLTDTATRLKSLETRLNELPEVDRARVDQIRQLVDSGEYEIDSKLIAQRIVQLEQALAPLG